MTAETQHNTIYYIICICSHSHDVTISGGGEREKVFWRNYFFHCAFTRYEAGLSIDEIWSDEAPPVVVPAASASEEEAVKGGEEEIHFEAQDDTTTAATTVVQEEDDIFREEKTSSPSSEYEIVDSVQAGEDDDDEDAFDGEMDELEAEIAQALGD